MKQLFGILSRYTVLFCTVACASNATPTVEPNVQRADSPRVVARGARPEFRLPSISSTGSVIDVTFRVMVDSAGHPDMGTFKVTGFGASENRDALAAWIQQAIFRPAQRDGQPVAGMYVERVQVRIRRSP